MHWTSFFLGALATAFGLVLLRVVTYRTFQPWEAVILLRGGRVFKRQRGGALWMLKPFWAWVTLDLRETTTAVPAQEVITRDGIQVKVSVIVTHKVADEAKAFELQDVTVALYSIVQLALRTVVGRRSAEDLLGNRQVVDDELAGLVAPQADRIGLALPTVAVRDVMLPAEWKRANLQVLVARQESVATLERARGETATLRSLANAARQLDKNPNLLQLRTLQAVTAIGQGQGNTVVFGMPANAAVQLRTNGDGAEGSEADGPQE